MHRHNSPTLCLLEDDLQRRHLSSSVTPAPVSDCTTDNIIQHPCTHSMCICYVNLNQWNISASTFINEANIQYNEGIGILLGLKLASPDITA